MSRVERTALVSCSAQQIFDVIADVEQYPNFLPWCDSAHVLEKTDVMVKAGLGIDYHGVKQRFTTQNDLTEYSLIHMQLIDGPFKHLDGRWEFITLEENACKVNFTLDFEFNNFVLHKLAAPIFSQIANTMLDSFVERTKQLHGQ